MLHMQGLRVGLCSPVGGPQVCCCQVRLRRGGLIDEGGCGNKWGTGKQGQTPTRTSVQALSISLRDPPRSHPVYPRTQFASSTGPSLQWGWLLVGLKAEGPGDLWWVFARDVYMGAASSFINCHFQSHHSPFTASFLRPTEASHAVPTQIPLFQG